MPFTDFRNEPDQDTARAAGHHLRLPSPRLHRRPGENLLGLVPGRQSIGYMHNALRQNFSLCFLKSAAKYPMW